MEKEKSDILTFSNELRDLLKSELDISVGNMEILPLAEQVFKLATAAAYDEGILDAQRTIESNLENIIEQLDELKKNAP